jgi:hypothetical protein
MIANKFVVRLRLKNSFLKKCKAVPLRTMEAQGGEEVKLLLWHYLGTDGMNGQRHASAALYLSGKEPRHPLQRRLGEP